VSRLIGKRLASMVGIILLLTGIVFLLQKLSKTNPVHAYLGANASSAAIARESHILGYDKPLFSQYIHYLSGLLQGSLAQSLRTRRPVATDIGAYLPATVELTLAGLVMALILATLFGMALAGRWRGRSVFRVVMLSGASAPSFLLALLGILLLSGHWHLLPATGDTGLANAPSGPTGMIVVDGLLHGQLNVFWDGILHLIIPAFCIALGPAVSIGRVLQGSLTSAMRSDFVRTARAKGLSERQVLLRHALRNSLTAALSMTGLQLGLMLAGVVVIETVFAWPGIGLYIDQSIPAADFPAIAGVTLVLGIGYVAINTVVDILQATADPRMKAA
jgi:peptide/nickel transport system permease protein